MLASLFFAGAALTAGAGGVTLPADEATAADAPATVATDPAPAAPAADPASEPDAAPTAPAVAPAADPAAAPEAAPAATPPADPATPAEAAAAPTDAAATAPAAPDPTPQVAPAPSTTAPSAPAVRRSSPQRRPAAKPAARPLPVPVAAAPVFYPTVPFDLQAWVHDNPASPLGAAAVAIAEHYIGTPYVWGAASPTSGFDCSGLTMFVYAQLGIALPHYAASQFAAFAKLDASQLEPGDLVFFEPRADGPGHVAIYAGNDTIIEAPHTGALVRIGSLSGSAAALGFLGAVRPYGAAAGTRTLFAFTPGVLQLHGGGPRLA